MNLKAVENLFLKLSDSEKKLAFVNSARNCFPGVPGIEEWISEKHREICGKGPEAEEPHTPTSSRDPEACKERGKNCKLISIFNFKGGVGKTTVATNLCAAFARLGKNVALVDADTQASATSFFLERKPEDDAADTDLQSKKYGDHVSDEDARVVEGIATDAGSDSQPAEEGDDASDLEGEDDDFHAWARAGDEDEAIVVQHYVDSQKCVEAESIAQAAHRDLFGLLYPFYQKPDFLFDDDMVQKVVKNSVVAVNEARKTPGSHTFLHDELLANLAEKARSDGKAVGKDLFLDIMLDVGLQCWPGCREDCSDAYYGASKQKTSHRDPADSDWLKKPPDDFGKMYLLPGGPALGLFERWLHKNDAEDVNNGGVLFGCFRYTMKELAMHYGLDYIIIDVGPMNSLLNNWIVMSCDYILPPSFADRFSAKAAHNLYSSVIPSFRKEAEKWNKRGSMPVDAVRNDWLKADLRSEALHTSFQFNVNTKILPFLITSFPAKNERNVRWGAVVEKSATPWIKGIQRFTDKCLSQNSQNCRAWAHPYRRS